MASASFGQQLQNTPGVVFNATTNDDSASHMSLSVSREQVPQKALEGAQAELDRASVTIKGLENDLAVAQSPEKRRAAMTADLENDLKGTGAEVYRNHELIVVRIKESAFKRGSNKSDQEMKKSLAPIAKAALKNAADYDLMIEGHTDAIPVKNHAKYADNWQMGFARAAEVEATLRGLMLRDEGIAIASRGSNLAASKDKNGAANRRVEFVFMPKRDANVPISGDQKDASTNAPTPEPVVSTAPSPTPEASPSATPTPSATATPTAQASQSPAPSPSATPAARSLDQEGDQLFSTNKAAK